jgi:hypothetical protein
MNSDIEKIKQNINDQIVDLNFPKSTIEESMKNLSVSSMYSFWTTIKSMLDSGAEEIIKLKKDLISLEKQIAHERSIRFTEKADSLILEKQYLKEVESMKNKSEWYEKYEIADQIVSSEQFSWMMAGSKNNEANIEALKPLFNEWKWSGGKSGGPYN